VVVWRCGCLGLNFWSLGGPLCFFFSTPHRGAALALPRRCSPPTVVQTYAPLPHTPASRATPQSVDSRASYTVSRCALRLHRLRILLREVLDNFFFSYFDFSLLVRSGDYRNVFLKPFPHSSLLFAHRRFRKMQ